LLKIDIEIAVFRMASPPCRAQLFRFTEDRVWEPRLLIRERFIFFFTLKKGLELLAPRDKMTHPFES
jgi:hypothetical protein